MTHYNRKQIIAFLIKAKQLLQSGRYTFVNRRKSLNSLMQYGISIEEVKNEIMDLTVKDYHSGPLMDDDLRRMGEIWIFKKEINHTVFYIKFSLDSLEDGEFLKCVSFHEDGME